MAGDDSLITAIKLAALAGGLRFWARETPEAERGLIKLADEYTRKSKAALERAMRLDAGTSGLRFVGK